MKICAIDLDGVIRDTYSPLISIYKKQYDSKFTGTYMDIKDYDLRLFSKMKSPQMFYDHRKELFLYSRPMPCARVMLDTLKDMGHNIQIITYQYRGLEHLTCDWLHKWEIPYDTLHFSRDKTITNADILLDDKIENVKEFQVSRPDRVGVCVAAPWNDKFVGNKIYNLIQFLEYVK